MNILKYLVIEEKDFNKYYIKVTKQSEFNYDAINDFYNDYDKMVIILAFSREKNSNKRLNFNYQMFDKKVGKNRYILHFINLKKGTNKYMFVGAFEKIGEIELENENGKVLIHHKLKKLKGFDKFEGKLIIEKNTPRGNQKMRYKGEEQHTLNYFKFCEM